MNIHSQQFTGKYAECSNCYWFIIFSNILLFSHLIHTHNEELYNVQWVSASKMIAVVVLRWKALGYIERVIIISQFVFCIEWEICKSIQTAKHRLLVLLQKTQYLHIRKWNWSTLLFMWIFTWLFEIKHCIEVNCEWFYYLKTRC